ncbi:hypothetical protein J8273_6509 [Carpediemonas membranifera]|uniref:K Homology domain-containing protein n=1 Tax=Carpediemonas membranifera TaxID=201153 RepID=A0A8J6E065_9EUKA|nr:hypothetical protein J8273_6509 [Carpediemonas membranifera]|eukprot:KAG9391733.1 hypothetical protein J8273_6509 [Carpediemonas membranifera]
MSASPSWRSRGHTDSLQKTIRMNIDPTAISFLIGRKGSTVSSIRARSKAVVSFQEGGIAIIRGSEEQTRLAKNLIEEKLAEWKQTEQAPSGSMSRCASMASMETHRRMADQTDSHVTVEFLLTKKAEEWLRSLDGIEGIAKTCRTDDGTEPATVSVYHHVLRVHCPTERLYLVKDSLHATITAATDESQPWPTTVNVKRHTAHQNHGPDPPDAAPLVRVVHIPNGSERVLIGQNGSTVQGIRDKTGTTIRFDNGWAIVKGPAHGVREALGLIVERLQSNVKIDGTRGKKTVTLPLYADRYLVGPRAATLRHIREQTGVTLRVEVTSQSSEAQGALVLVGQPENIEEAEQEVAELLCDFSYARLPIVQSLIGRIIGRNGENLKRIVKLANNDVALFLPSDSSGDKYAVIAGPVDTVVMTRKLFISRMALLQSHRCAMFLSVLPPRRSVGRTPRAASYTLVPHVDDNVLVPSAETPALGIETPRQTPPQSPATLFAGLSSRLESLAKQETDGTPVTPTASMDNVYGVTPYGHSVAHTPTGAQSPYSTRPQLVQFTLDVAEAPIGDALFGFSDSEMSGDEDFSDPVEEFFFADRTSIPRALAPGEKTISLGACWFDAALAGARAYWEGAVARALSGMLGHAADSSNPAVDGLGSLPDLEISAYVGRNVINIMAQPTTKQTKVNLIADNIHDRRYDARFWAGVSADAADRLVAAMPLPGDVTEGHQGSFHVSLVAADATLARSKLLTANLPEGDVAELPDTLVLNRKPLGPADRAVWRQVTMTRHVDGITGPELSPADLSSLAPADGASEVTLTGASAQILVATPHPGVDISFVIKARPRVVRPTDGTASALDNIVTAAGTVPLGCVFQTTARSASQSDEATPVIALPLPDIDAVTMASFDGLSDVSAPGTVSDELLARAAVGEQEIVPFEGHATLRHRRFFVSGQNDHCIALSQMAMPAGTEPQSVNVNIFKAAAGDRTRTPAPALVAPTVPAVVSQLSDLLRTAIVCAETIAE